MSCPKMPHIAASSSVRTTFPPTPSHTPSPLRELWESPPHLAAAWTASPNIVFRTAIVRFQVFPFVHTFPAYDESRRTWVESSCKRCPETAAVLRRLPNIRTALFSRLGGGSRISGHRGWADLANHVLRCHLPIKVPSDGVCGLWVESEVRVEAF